VAGLKKQELEILIFSAGSSLFHSSMVLDSNSKYFFAKFCNSGNDTAEQVDGQSEVRLSEV
jgi:hypothetical protein